MNDNIQLPRETKFYMFPKDEKKEDDEVDHLADWMYRVPQVKYSPLHWLAYWNDYPTIEYLLGHVDKNDEK